MTHETRHGRKGQPLPVPQGHYDDRDETVTRRTIEQNFEDLYTTISELQADILDLEAVSTDFFYDIATGAIENNVGVNKFGRNSDIDTTTDPADVWDGGVVGGASSIWVAPTVARIHDITSTSVNDTSAGSGAQTIALYGLVDWNSLETSEELSMNGASNVPTANAYVIIHRMIVLTVGAGATNAGDIKATAQTDGTVTAQISIGRGQTTMAIYGVPSIQSFVLTNWYATVNRTVAGGASSDLELRVNPTPNDDLDFFVVKHHLGVADTGDSHFVHNFQPYYKIEGPAIVKVQVENVSDNATDLSAGFDGILITETS